MSSSDSEGETRKRDVLPLSRVSRNSFEPRSLLRGRILNVNPYKDNRATFKIKDDKGTLSIELRGDWAEEAIKKLNRIGTWITLTGRDGLVEAVTDKKGRQIVTEDGFKQVRVVYSNGIEGVWGPSGKGSSFSFQGDPAPSTRYHAASTNPHARPSSTSSSKQQRAIAKLNQKEPTQATTIDEEILAVPLTNPENPYAGQRALKVATSERGGDGHSSDQADHDSARSEEGSGEEQSEQTVRRDGTGEPQRKKQKRVREEPRREWGLQTNRPALKYSPLSVVEVDEKRNDLNLIAIAIVRRAPYKSTRDPATDLWLYDPTHFIAPAPLFYFGKKEEHLPILEDGDILIAQKIHFKRDRKMLTAYGNLINGRFLVIPSKLALEYDGGSASTLVASLPKSSERLAQVKEEEFAYARDLARWSEKYDIVGNHKEPDRGEKPKFDAKAESVQFWKGAKSARKLVKISELDPDGFYDVQGEIVKFYNPTGRKNFDDKDVCQLYITDYTLNSQLVCYGDLSTVQLPGQYALQVSIWGHQAAPLLKFNSEQALVGKFVYLRNIKTKTNSTGFLEATMWIDDKCRNASDVTLKKEVELSRVSWSLSDYKRRRSLYCHSSMEAKLTDANLTVLSEEKLSAASDPLASTFDLTGLEAQSMSIACANKLTGTYRFIARVIDYKPDNLEEFVVAYCTRCKARLPPGITACLDHDAASHMFQFAIVLEGDRPSPRADPTRILVEVTGVEAEALFPGLAPRQICENPSTYLPSLTSRLSPILGNELIASKAATARAASRGTTLKKEEKAIGPEMDFVVEAFKGKGQSDELRWKFDPDRTAFVETARD